MDKIAATLTKRFSDKPDAKRGLKSLEAQVTNQILSFRLKDCMICTIQGCQQKSQ